MLFGSELEQLNEIDVFYYGCLHENAFEGRIKKIIYEKKEL